MENKEKTTMVMERMYVDNYHFGLVEAQKDDPVDSKRPGTEIMHRFLKIDSDRAKVELRARFGDGQKPPFFFDVTIGAIFSCEKFESSQSKLSLMKNDTLAILFPYLRSTLASLSAIAGVDLCVLPVVNTFDLFGDQTLTAKKK
jgi:preprotein translocase subunit SecB